MSKENISVNDILEEFSPDGHKVEETDTNHSNGTPTDTPVQAPKSLEQLELERLEAISQGELSDTTINYSSYSNKPNKVIENPTQSKEFNPYYTKGVVKISSRPEFKEKVDTDRKEVSNNRDDGTSNEPIRIDSRNTKAKLESTNRRKDYSRSHNEISDEDFSSMSEKLQRAKAKRQHQIDELNSKYKPKASEEVTSVETETPTATPIQEETAKPKKEKKKLFNLPKKEPKVTEPIEEVEEEEVAPLEETSTQEEGISSETQPVETIKTVKKKKSIFQRILDYYTYTVDENGETIPPEEEHIETIVESEPLDVEPIDEDIHEDEELPEPKHKETFKEFMTSLFTSKEKPTPIKKETFKERMVEFFTVPDEELETTSPEEVDETVETTPIVEEPKPMPTPVVEEPKTTPTPVMEEPKPMPNPVVEEPKPMPTPVMEEPKPMPTPVVEEPKPTPTPVVEAPSNAPTPEEVAHVEEIVNDILNEDLSEGVPHKKPNVFRRIKEYFLMDEIQQLSTDSDDVEETSMDLEEPEEVVTPMEEPTPEPVVETPKPTETPKPMETSATKPVVETIAKPEEPIKPLEERAETVEEKSKEDYILPFSEDTPDEDIDIPIEETVRYKHFWQDPDFNPIDRFKTYVEETSEKYRNRKRSGEIHIEIKSNPDTAILFSDLENKVLAEEELLKSREEFKKQVENGEYDDYDENSKNVETEPTFQSTSINDFNAYAEKPRVQEQISEMETGIFVRKTIIGVLCVLSTYIALANDLGLPTVSALNVETSASGYLMVQSVCGLVAILTCIKSVASGIVKIFQRKADSDSFSSVGIVSAFVASLVTFLMASQVTETKMLNVYMPIALLGMFFNLKGKSYIVKREKCNFRYIGKDKPKYGLFCIQDDYDAEKFTKGLVDDYPITAYTRKTNFTSDFIKYTYSYDMADRFSKFAVPIVCVVAVIVSLISALVYNMSFDMVFPVGFFSILSMLLSFCSCFSIPVYINSMLYHVSRKYAKREGALLGYQAVEDFYDTNSLIVNAKDIFPKGSINISALKLFSNAKVDETLVYAISLANKVDSILAPTLLEMLDGNLDLLCNVENCSYEDGLGICGWIDNKRVLMGNRELMETHNIENLPTKSKEMEMVGSNRDCIYISVSGNLSLMLILDIVPNAKVAQDLQAIQDNGIALAITSCDFLVSINKVSRLFDVDGDNIKVIPYEVYEETKEYFTDKPKCSTSIVTNGDIGMMVNLLLATKKVHAKATFGNVLNAVSCILGILIGISFISMGGFRELTSTMVLMYNLICTGIIMLICNSKKF